MEGVITKSDDLERYQRQLHRKLEKLSDILSPAVVGKFDTKFSLPPEDDEFYEIYVGVELLYEVIREKIKELEELNTELGDRIRVATENLQEAQAVAGVGSWAWDINDDKIEWSPQLYKMFGLKPESLKATFQEYLKLVHPDDAEMIQELINTSLKTHKPFEFEHRLLRDGKLLWLHSVGQVSLDKSGKPYKMFGTAQDVTDRKLAAEALQERTDELEKFNSVMIGRELKMAELKEEIEKLKRQLNEK